MPGPTASDPKRAQIVEDVHVEWFAHLAGVPGLEVHCDPDIAWKVSPASAWSNCGVRVRLSERNAEARLDEVLTRYRTNGRGAGLWIGPSAQPANLETLLKARRLRCRKYFPAMYCDLRNVVPSLQTEVPLRFSAVTDYTIFRQQPHPSIGRITTRIRRFTLESQQHLASRSPRKSWDLMACCDDTPVGICTLFIGARYAGLFDAGVLELLRNQGIGRTLVRYACAFAQEHGAEGIILIAMNMGYRVYEHVGFKEVSRVGFWYTARP